MSGVFWDKQVWLSNPDSKADDIKNTLVATSLSYVDFYRPSYFLLENVRGMLSARLGGTQQGTKVVGGIKMGVVKFIYKALIAMEYYLNNTATKSKSASIKRGTMGCPSLAADSLFGVSNADSACRESHNRAIVSLKRAV